MRTQQPLAQRFWSKVNTTAGPDGCWPWTAGRDSHGYGRFWLDGHNLGAHRIAFELVTGEHPGALEIDHTCFNRACMNPTHLRPATHKQNNEHRRGAQRNSATGVRGVVRRGNRFVAVVMQNRRQIYVGTFAAVEEAAEAARAKRLELFTHSDMDKRGAA